jgi:hypothetical protein
MVLLIRLAAPSGLQSDLVHSSSHYLGLLTEAKPSLRRIQFWSLAIPLSFAYVL